MRSAGGGTGTGAESRGAEEAVMPKGSKELEEARREEIVDACERLYSKMSYGEIGRAHI